MAKLTLKAPLSPETQEKLARIKNPPVKPSTSPVKENKANVDKPPKTPKPPHKAKKAPRTPEEVAALQQAEQEMAREKAEAVKFWLEGTFPQTFNFKNPKPLKIGIHKDILNREPPFSPTQIRKVLDVYVNSPEYLKSVLNGSCRYDLDGAFVGDVSPEQKNWVEKRFASQKPSLDQDNV